MGGKYCAFTFYHGGLYNAVKFNCFLTLVGVSVVPLITEYVFLHS